MEMPTNWIELGVMVFLPLLTALLLWTSRKLEAAILRNVKNEELKVTLLRLNDEVFDVVGEVKQTMADRMKEASQDGKLTEQEREQLLSIAVGKWKSLQGPEGVRRVREILGMDEQALEKRLVQKIEAAVAKLPQRIE